jgi:ribonucleoside-diphosphate reductase alpha chain
MTTPLTFGSRRKLPARRRGYNQKLTIMAASGRVAVHLRTGNYPDGMPGEIFVDIAQNADPSLRAMLNMWAVAVSLALQHGCPLATLTELYTFTRFEPSGPVRDHVRIKMCTSIVDVIFRDLAIHYLQRDDLAHVEAGV